MRSSKAARLAHGIMQSLEAGDETKSMTKNQRKNVALLIVDEIQVETEEADLWLGVEVVLRQFY